jgi:hydroxypyruvate reductase
LVAIGKAAWRMAYAAKKALGRKIIGGIVITKYDHSGGAIPGVDVFEAGHPVPDENTLLATKTVLDRVLKLDQDTPILFLVSGGGSALFELPMEGISLQELMDTNRSLVNSGAGIIEMNCVRKHLSQVKGGRFAEAVFPRPIYAFLLSDCLGDRIDTIASGPAFPDASTSQEALSIVRKYKIRHSERMEACLKIETPKTLCNSESQIIGSVTQACHAAKEAANQLGYTPLILTTTLDCEAREAGRFMSAIAREIKQHHNPLEPPCAIIAGGETVVQVRGSGKGGRNQELAFSAALGIQGMDSVAIASVGTDGTDGPTDAAGGIVDGQSIDKLCLSGIDPWQVLADNDTYHGLKAIDALLITGPTGTNVNDVTLLLIR